MGVRGRKWLVESSRRSGRRAELLENQPRKPPWPDRLMFLRCKEGSARARPTCRRPSVSDISMGVGARQNICTLFCMRCSTSSMASFNAAWMSSYVPLLLAETTTFQPLPTMNVCLVA